MAIIRIGATALAQVQQLWQRSRYQYQSGGAEDLADLLKNELVWLGVTADGGWSAQAWGLLAIQAEARPVTLPAAAPARAYVRAIALVRSHHPTAALPPLLDAAQHHLQTMAEAQLLICYGEPDWLYRALLQAAFTLAEQVQFFALPHLIRWQPDTRSRQPMLQLRPGQPADLPALARLDGVVFDPLWHMGEQGLQGLLVLGRLQVAETAGQLVGYSAIHATDGYAHLSRLAVHPNWQGRGYGRALLVDALLYAQHEGVNTVMLNTQAQNHPAQQLYRQIGFRPTGQVVPVLTRLVTPHRVLAPSSAG